MKKHIICIVITIFTALFCACCHAQQNITYNIDIIPMSIVLPDSYIGLTRSISEDDKYFICRSYAEAPDVDGRIYVKIDENSANKIVVGEYTKVRIINYNDYDLFAEVI